MNWQALIPWVVRRERVVADQTTEDGKTIRVLVDAGENRNPRPVPNRTLAPHCWMGLS